MSAGRSAHQDEKVVGEVAPGLKDEKVQEHGHDPMEGPDLEVVSNKLDCSQRVVENQKQMLATVQSLIELVRFRALSGFRAMRRFRDLLCSLIYCVEIQVSSPGGGMNGVSDLYKSSASSVVQYDDDDMDPISESLLSSGTRRQAMLTSDTLTGTSDSRGNKSSGDEISSQSNMLIKTRLMFSANDNDSTANGIEPRSIHAVPTPLKSRVAAQYSSDREAVGPILFPLPATQLRPMVRTQDSVEVEWMRCKMPETEATPLRGSVRFQYPIEEEGEEDGGAEIGAGDIEGRRSRLREVDATPLRSTIRFQYPIEEEGEEDGGAEIGAGDIEGRRSRLREVDATPLRSTIRFQYPIEEEGEEDGGAEIGAGDIEGRRSRLREVDATPLRSTIRFQYPIEEEGEEDGGAEMGAGDIEGRRSRLREVDATPLRSTIRFQYPIEEEGEEDGGAEIGAGDIEGRRSRLREVDATPLRSTIRFQYPIEEEGEEDGGAEIGAGDIEGRRSRLREVDATPLRSTIRFQYPIEEEGEEDGGAAGIGAGDIEGRRSRLREVDATPLRSTIRFQYPIEEEGEEDGGAAEIGAGDIEGRRSRLREVDATPLRSTIRFQYPIEEEGEEDGGAEIGAGDIEGRRSRLREVDATPLRSTIRFQYPIEEEGEEDGGAEIGAGDIEGRRSRLREVDATPLRSTIRFQYPIEEEGEEDGGAEIGAGDIEGRRSRLREVWFQYPEAGIDEAEQDVMGVEPDREALEISVKPMIEPRGYTPLSKVVSRRYPINSRVKREESTPIAMPVGGPSFHDLSSAEAERYLGVRLPLQHWAVGSQEMSPTPRCLSSSRGGEMVTLQSKQEREGKENWIHLAKPNSNGSRGQGPEQATREMPFSDLRPPTNDTPLKFYELSLPASRKVIPPKRLVR
jgi:hypothetical protein